MQLWTVRATFHATVAKVRLTQQEISTIQLFVQEELPSPVLSTYVPLRDSELEQNFLYATVRSMSESLYIGLSLEMFIIQTSLDLIQL